MPVKLALSTLCENPGRRTGLSTLFPELVAHSRRIYPEVSWIVFAGRDGAWPEGDPAIEVCRDFHSNERPLRRLLADQLDDLRRSLQVSLAQQALPGSHV